MARFLRNPHTGPLLEDRPTRAPLEFHRRLPGYRATPLVDVSELAERLGLDRLYVKNESSRLGLPSFKILGASWGVYRAVEEHVGGIGPWHTLDDLAAQLGAHEPLTLVAATDGNHGRAVARMARLLELEARIFVPKGTAPARITAIEEEGARCDVVDGTYDDAVVRSAREASETRLVISDTSWPGYEQVPRWIIDGYSTIFWELDDELAGRGLPRPDLVVVQIGVGALAAAAARHFRRADGPPAHLMGVEPDRAACVFASVEAGELTTVPGPHDSLMAGLNCGTPSLVALPLVSAGFDSFVKIADDRAVEAMRVLASAGIVAGETGAAGLGCLMELADGRLDRFRRALLLCTEGATDPLGYERAVGRPPHVVGTDEVAG